MRRGYMVGQKRKTPIEEDIKLAIPIRRRFRAVKKKREKKTWGVWEWARACNVDEDGRWRKPLVKVFLKYPKQGE